MTSARGRTRLGPAGLTLLIAMTFVGCSPSGCSFLGCSPDRPAPPSGSSSAATEQSPIVQPPNVLLVVVDTVRADRMHYLGYERETTPHLDEFMRSSTRTLAHFSHSSRTGPSVASIITGRLPGSHGVVNPLDRFDAKGRLSNEQVTMAEHLKTAGYVTFGIVTNPNISDRFGFGQGFDLYEYFADQDHGQRVNREALALLDEHESSDGPFFMYLHYMNPHSDYAPDPAFQGLFADAEYSGSFDGSHAQLDRVVGGRERCGPDDLEQLSALYDEEIRSFDERFGELLSSLGDRGLRDNTIIVFVSDHGEEFQDHGSLLHGYTLYGEQLRVPFAIHDPRNARPSAAQTFSRHIDVLPTLLDLLEIESDDAAEGLSIFSPNEATAGETPGPFRDVIGFVQLRAVKTVRVRSLLHDGWKLIVDELPSERVQLYRIVTDPGEQTDLASENPAKAAELRAILDAATANDRSTAAPAAADLVELSEEEREALRQLGYLPSEEDPEAPGDDHEE